MRARRGAAAGVALATAGLLAAGCGSATGGRSGTDRAGAEGRPSASAPRVPGVDGSAAPARVFTEERLERALLDGHEFPGGARAVWNARGTFNQVAGVPEGGDLWADCPAGSDDEIAELAAFRAPSVVRHLVPGEKATEIRPEVLLSMTTERAERYVELKRAIYRGCPRTAVDAEAGPPHIWHFRAEDVEIGDDAFIEKAESKDADADVEDAAQRGPSYRVYVRMGGVIVTLGDWRDRDAALVAAAKAAEKVRTTLYADASPGPGRE